MAEIQPSKITQAWQVHFQGAWPSAVAFLGANRFAAGNLEGQIYIWELPDKPGGDPPPPVRRLDGHTNAITRLVATADGKTLVSASYDRSVRVWDLTVPAESMAEAIMDVKDREAEVKKTRKPDAMERPGVMVEVQTECQILEGHRDWVRGLGLSADEKRLISGDSTCQVIVWDFPARKEICRWTGYPGDWVTAAALSADGQTAFVAEYLGSRGDFDRPPAQVRFFNASDGTEKLDVLKVMFPNVKVRDNSYGYAQTWNKFTGRGLICAAFSPDGKIVAAGQGGETDTGQVHLIEAATGKTLRSTPGHRYGVTDVIFSPDGKYVISSGRDTSLRITKVDDGKEVAVLGKSRGGQFTDWTYSLAISADQRWLVASDISGEVFVWNCEA